MKANEAPEKLYLLPNGLISYCRTNEDVEYIHTDTFIEKAAKWINEHTSLSEKLVIENFINYMKGE
jgi:hypothetical protein